MARQASRPSDPGGVLAGTRVLDLTAGVCGAYATKLLADAGADVVKIEPPGGAPLRRATGTGDAPPPGQDAAFFQFLNASKRSAVLDLERPGDRNRFRGLVPGAALVFEDMGPGRIEALGLGHAELSALDPRVCLVSISPFGRGGPWSERPATEFTLQALAGSTLARGLPGQEPISVGGRLGEFVAAAFAAPAALAAAESARRGGRGSHVDVAIYEAMLVSFQTFRWIFRAFEPAFVLNRDVEIPSVEPARDGYIGFTCVTAQQWKDFTLLIEAPELGEDPSLFASAWRFQRREELWARIHAYTRRHTVEEILARAELLRVPAAPVAGGVRVPEIDHFAQRGVFVKNPAGFLQPRVPYSMESAPPRPFAPAPRLGEHTAEVLAAPPSASPAPRAAATPAAGSSGPRTLAGVRVLDLTAFWAGPVATWSLAAFGADVVKLESIQRPDMMRFSSGFERETLWEWSPIYHGANSGKRGLTLDLGSPEGLELLLRLVERSDVLVENFSPRVLGNLGLSWERLRERNPRLVLVRMPAFGLDGPWRDRVGFAMTIEQVSGLAWRTGHPDGVPIVPRGPCDPLGAAHAVLAILLALRQRETSGRGQRIEVPLVEPGLNAAAQQVVESTAYGASLGREGNRSADAAPQGVYRTAGEDAWLALAVETDRQWAGLREVLGDPGWAAAPGLATHAGRLAERDAIDAPLRAWFAPRDASECAERLLAAGVPAAPLESALRVGSNPQAGARGFFQELEHPITGRTPYPSFPARFDGAYPAISRPSPALGQHSEEILAELLGMSATELAGLRERKVIGTRPAFV